MEKAARVAKSVTGCSGILSAARVASSLEGLTVDANNCEQYFRARYNADGAGASTVYIDGAALATVLKGVKGPVDVDIQPDGLTAGGLTVAGVDPLSDELGLFDTPDLTEVQGVMSWTGKNFKAAVKRWGAVAKTDKQTTRMNLRGVYFEFTEQTTDIVTCDGYHLLRETYGGGVPQPAIGAGSMDRAIFKRDNPIDCGLFDILEIKRILPLIRPNDNVRFTVYSAGDNTPGEVAGKWLQIDVYSSWGDARLLIKGTDEQYPDYRRVIPQNNDKAVFKIYAPDLAPVATAAKRAAPDDSGHCWLEITPDTPDRLTVNSGNGVSTYAGGVNITAAIGRADKMDRTGINCHFLELLSNFAGDTTAELSWAAPLQAIRADFTAPDGTACNYIMMPTNPN